MRRAALLCFLFPCAAFACKCQMTLSVCNEVAATDIIFVGTVEAIEPSFLDSWNAGQRAALDLLNQESARAQFDRSPAAFAKLRDAYLKVFPDLPADHKKRLAAATSPDQLAELFYWILDHGKRVRLRVKTVFRGEIGDDDDDKTPAKTVEVWTAFGDCGITFQTGETYLVYADDDEESNIMTTGACTRTRRLTDAGDDLAYLYFFKNYADNAGRVEGFVTGDLLFLARPRPGPLYRPHRRPRRRGRGTEIRRPRPLHRNRRQGPLRLRRGRRRRFHPQRLRARVSRRNPPARRSQSPSAWKNVPAPHRYW